MIADQSTKARGSKMKRQLTAKMLLASLALAPLAVAPASTLSAQQVVSPKQDILLSIGRGELVTIPGAMTDVFIANETGNACSQDPRSIQLTHNGYTKFGEDCLHLNVYTPQVAFLHLTKSCMQKSSGEVRSH